MKKIILVFIILIVIMISNFIVNDSNEITMTKIKYNGNNLKISVDGNNTNNLPTNGNYYLVDYDCSNNNTKVIWNKEEHKLNISNGTKKGSVSCFLEFKSKPFLSEVAEGSYVAYTGDSSNGCDNTTTVNGWTSCSGKNANYVSDTNMGYCSSSNYKYSVNGWRVGYTKNGNAYLISAGSPECMCTDSSGTASNSSCSSEITNTNDIYIHHDNMHKVALKYCNSNYSYNGICDNTTSWAMGDDDFQNITGSTTTYCWNKVDNFDCGWQNDLIGIDSYYWLASGWVNSIDSRVWSPINNALFDYNKKSKYLYGVRPILYLDSSVVVTGGSGTYKDPYTIDNNYFNVNSDNLSAAELSLNAVEDNVSMCISVDTSVCTNYIDYSDTYTLDLSSYSEGEHIIYVYYRDSNGDIVASMNRSVNIE